ncbi:kinase-like protein, partial [Hyaloscypha hepaticicola]
LLQISEDACHEDLLSLLSLVQMLEVDILPLVWYPALHIGRGGFAVLNEAPVNNNMSFAFKRLINLGSMLEKDSGSFMSSMTEIAILRHKNIMKHPNIVELYGICWEVNPIRAQILPVLVLEKARYGDLCCFRNSLEGQKLSVKTKLSLCTQIAEGLAILHAALIIHGDMKPQNILICEGDGGGLVAKIADFGSSRSGQEEEDMHQLHHSGIWSAPEYHHREFSIAAAKKMDAYSFCLVCLWLLLD